MEPAGGVRARCDEGGAQRRPSLVPPEELISSLVSALLRLDRFRVLTLDDLGPVQPSMGMEVPFAFPADRQ